MSCIQRTTIDEFVVVRLWCSVVMTAVLRFRWPAMCIHGDKSQPERDWVLAGTCYDFFFVTSLIIPPLRWVQ